MPKTLFNRDVARESGPFSFGTKPMEVLERWAHPEAEALRRRIEGMVQAYPAEGRETLWRRCLNKSISQANDAFFELCISHLFTSRGFTLLGVENPLADSSFAIDFTFRSPAGVEFLVEVVSFNKSKQLTGPDKLLNEVLNAIDTLKSPHYEVLVSKSWGALSQAVGRKQVVHRVAQWLSTLPSPDSPRAMAALISKDFNLAEGVGFTLSPRLRRPNGARKGLIAAVPIRSSKLDVIGGIRRKLHQKAFKYGKLDLPLVIALNVAPEIVASHRLFKKAVYGPPKQGVESCAFTGHPSEYVPSCGALIEAGGPLSSIPAVLGFVGVHPLQFNASQGRAYHSLFAQHLDLRTLELLTEYAPQNIRSEAKAEKLRPLRRYPLSRGPRPSKRHVLPLAA